MLMIDKATSISDPAVAPKPSTLPHRFGWLAATSLVLCVGTIAAWWRSYAVTDYVCAGVSPILAATSSRGVVLVWSAPTQPLWQPHATQRPPIDLIVIEHLRFGGFSGPHHVQDNSDDYNPVVAFPWWAATFVTLVTPVLWAVLLVRRRSAARQPAIASAQGTVFPRFGKSHGSHTP
jgi:hypothetical protein